MSRTGENIYKKKDGRWEGRYIKSYTADGKDIIANCKLVHTPSIDYESYYKRLKCIRDEINHHLIVLNQIGTLEEPRFNHLCEDAVKTAKELSGELTEKLDIEIEKAKEVNT